MFPSTEIESISWRIDLDSPPIELSDWYRLSWVSVIRLPGIVLKK
jgi:hypothetical protein